MNRVAYLLSAMTFAPAAVALGLAVVTSALRRVGRDLPEGMWRGIGLGTFLFTAMLAVWLWTAFDPASARQFQFIEVVAWIPEWGLTYFVGVDGISLLLLLLTAAVFPLVYVASWDSVVHHVRTWVALLLLLETSLIGFFTALDAVQFFVWLELGLLPLALLVALWGGEGRMRAAAKLLGFQATASALLFVAFLVLHVLTAEQTGLRSFDLVPPPGATGSWLDTVLPVVDSRWWATQHAVFVALAAAFAILTAVVPFHVWATGAMREGPVGAASLIASVVVKIGAYGFLRCVLPLAPIAAVDAAGPMMALGAAALLYGALASLGQRTAIGFLAHVSQAQLGWLLLGWFSFSVAGIEGGIVYMIHHGASLGALFLLLGMLRQRAGTDALAAFGGVAKPMPVYMALLGVLVLSTFPIPGAMGFAGSFLILLGALPTGVGPAVVGSAAALLLALGWAWNVRRIGFGPVSNPANRGLIDLGWRERIVILAFIVPIVGLGIHPETLTARLHQPVLKLRRVMLDRAIASNEAAPHPLAARAIARLEEAPDERAGGGAWWDGNTATRAPGSEDPP